NPAATSSNIVAHEWLFRFGIVSYMSGSVLFIFVTLALYRLFKEVDHSLAVQMVILGSLMPVPIFFINTVTDAAALFLARGEGVLDDATLHVERSISDAVAGVRRCPEFW